MILLIPSSMIKSIINERNFLREDAVRDVSSKWANNQTIIGPVLTIPVTTLHSYENDGEEKHYEEQHQIHILPEAYNVAVNLAPKSLYRGIYQVVVYESNLEFDGSYLIGEHFDPSLYHEIKWNQAFLTLGISDLRGIQESLSVDWNSDQLKVEPGSRIPAIIPSGITIPLQLNKQDLESAIPFLFNLDLQGSHELSLVPVGVESNFTMNSSWPDPSFSGNFLPDEREVSDAGFSANWKILELNRSFPQVWRDNSELRLSDSALGVRLLLPVDDYKKSLRSTKYAIMTITLTFLVFFLVEVLNRRRIHPFQYLLVGLALVLFYILLISISEHTTFNIAYFVSSALIVGMISLYSLSVFKNKKLSASLSVILIALYGFLFVTLQLMDYALLLGSLGLALILGATMYYTRRIDWYAN